MSSLTSRNPERAVHAPQGAEQLIQDNRIKSRASNRLGPRPIRWHIRSSCRLVPCRSLCSLAERRAPVVARDGRREKNLPIGERSLAPCSYYGGGHIDDADGAGAGRGRGTVHERSTMLVPRAL